MTPYTALARRSHEENWLPVLELATREVFEIMLGIEVKQGPAPEPHSRGEFTAVVGLAGALCGILTVCCDAKTAGRIAQGMLGSAVNSEDEVVDALGEICNMITGNFESGSARIKSTSQAAFDRIASMLRQRAYRLRIEGHTDDAPIHNSQFASNWELSTSRATEIVRLLIVRDGFVPDRLSAAGFAEYHPVASNHTNEGRGMNRRVDIVILGGPTLAAPIGGEADAHQARTAASAAERKAETKTAKPSAGLSPKALGVSTAADPIK